MIPAILSAVFVVYLYKTLNHPLTSDESAPSLTSDDNDIQKIASRLKDLQARIARLATTTNDGDSKR